MKKRKPKSNKPARPRKPVAPGSKKDEAGLKAQHSRTAELNALAGSINRVLKLYSPKIRANDFYQRLQRAFRKAGVKERLLLLWQLRNMEVNTAHQFFTLSPYPVLTIEKNRGQVVAALEVKGHINLPAQDSNCYYLQVVVCLWDKTDAAVVAVAKMTDWIPVTGGFPVYSIDFGKHARATEYLVFVRVVCGYNRKDYEMVTLEGMQVFDVGSFTKEGNALLEAYTRKSKAARVNPDKHAAPVERIQPIKVVDRVR